MIYERPKPRGNIMQELLKGFGAALGHNFKLYQEIIVKRT
jgi:hypothetical protein